MNLQEFAALKVGDTVINGTTFSEGDVTEVTPSGIRLQWRPKESRTSTGTTFFYSVNSTAWFHWSKADDVVLHETATDAGTAS